MSAGFYAPAMPYLEDFMEEHDHWVECSGCGLFDCVEVRHYLDSETAEWTCARCGHSNSQPEDNCYSAYPD